MGRSRPENSSGPIAARKLQVGRSRPYKILRSGPRPAQTCKAGPASGWPSSPGPEGGGRINFLPPASCMQNACRRQIPAVNKENRGGRRKRTWRGGGGCWRWCGSCTEAPGGGAAAVRFALSLRSPLSPCLVFFRVPSLFFVFPLFFFGFFFIYRGKVRGPFSGAVSRVVEPPATARRSFLLTFGRWSANDFGRWSPGVGPQAVRWRRKGEREAGRFFKVFFFSFFCCRFGGEGRR